MGSQIVSHPFDAAGFVAECTIELGFERRVQRTLELRARLVAECDEMPAEYVRLGRGVLDGQTLRDIAQ